MDDGTDLSQIFSKFIPTFVSPTQLDYRYHQSFLRSFNTVDGTILMYNKSTTWEKDIN